MNFDDDIQPEKNSRFHIAVTVAIVIYGNA